MSAPFINAMHEEVIETRPGFVKIIESDIKSKFSSLCQGVRVSLVSRAVLTYPPAGCAFPLKDAFPVLEGAEIISLENGLEKDLEVGAVAFFRRMRSKAHGHLFLLVLGWRHKDAVDAIVGLTCDSNGNLCLNLESGIDADGMPVYQSLGMVVLLFVCPRCVGCHRLEDEVSW